MVPSINGESGRIVGTLSVQNGETLIVDLSQPGAYFEVTISSPYSWQKMISNGI